ncbi:glycosyltransferase [Sphingomonas sp. BN140010]|uniref:Glycosyltransferase n=1 Tax=Sphingomonas arvum TaxID=2992113 RepID=A0ABT3JE72_9SPHN|nr:glycosyltransferase [Sphingomonas sp. BN140010]MCW3797364.1 glycosyltransferase [Sphingomonas sp. BN140010]
MSETAAIRHLDLRRKEPPVPSAELVYDVFWWGDLPIGAKASARGELPLGVGQLRALAADLLARQLAGREPALGAPLVAGSEGQPHRALSLQSAATMDHLEERLEELTSLPPCDASDIALIICTRDRPRALERCLASLPRQVSEPGQFIVVDNSASGSARALCANYGGIDYVHEPAPGLSRARNAGIRAARRPVLAFTDDDVEPHPAWLSEVSRAFRQHDVECVTGLVLPATLGTKAQRNFQFALGAFGNSFVPLLFDERFFAETRPHGAHVWRIGAGANMAFRRSAFDRAGLFDERLGAGASGCSEDSEFWYRLLALGGSCLYEPRAVVLHHHRSEWQELKSQVRVYMRGHVSALVAQHDAFGDRGNLRRIGLQLPKYFVRTGLGSLLHGRWTRLSLMTAEIRGWLAGLTYLARPGWRRRRGEWQKL